MSSYTSYSGNFATVAIQCLEKVGKDNAKCTFTCDRHTFNYLVSNGYSMALPLILTVLQNPLHSTAACGLYFTIEMSD